MVHSEHRRRYAWNDGNQTPEPLNQSEYRSSYEGKQTPVMGLKKSASIPNFEEVVASNENQMMTSKAIHMDESEYNAKFKPFSDYLYITGNGFIKPKNLFQLSDVDKAKVHRSYYCEFEERHEMANQYKTRSQLGHPLSSEGLAEIYSHGTPWNSYHLDRERQALDLASTQKTMDEKGEERLLYPNGHKCWNTSYQ